MTYEELCEDERWKVLMKRCENLPISKVFAKKVEDIWPGMPSYLRESFDANFDQDDIYYFESIAGVIDDFFLYNEESVTPEQHDEVLNWASKLKDTELIHFVER